MKVSSGPQALIRIPLVYRRASTKIDPITVGMRVPARTIGTRDSLAEAAFCCNYLTWSVLLWFRVFRIIKRVSRHGGRGIWLGWRFVLVCSKERPLMYHDMDWRLNRNQRTEDIWKQVVEKVSKNARGSTLKKYRSQHICSGTRAHYMCVLESIVFESPRSYGIFRNRILHIGGTETRKFFFWRN